MKIVIFTVKHISHVIPITEFINVLIKQNHELYIYGTQENKKYFNNKKIKYIHYTCDARRNLYEKIFFKFSIINSWIVKQYNVRTRNASA